MALKLVESRPATEDEKKRYQEIVNDQEWLAQHSVEIWEKYKGKYIAVVKQSLFVGDTWEEVVRRVKEKFSGYEPFVRHIPYKKRIWVV